MAVVAWVLIFRTLDFPEQICLKLCSERQATSKKDEQDDTAGPDVRRLPQIRLLLRQGWIHVVRRTAVHRELFLLIAFHSEAKIYYLYFILRADEDVVQLEVPVHDGPRMHVGHAFDYLREYLSYIVFLEARLLGLVRFFDQVVHAFAFAEFHDEVHIRPCIYHLMQRHDVLVVEDRQRVDFALQSHRGFWVFQVLLIVHFQRYLVTRFLMRCSLN